MSELPELQTAALARDVEALLAFGVRHHLLEGTDVLVARNTLLDLLGLAAPYEGALPPQSDDGTPTAILEPMLDRAAERGLFDDTVLQLRQNFEARLMGALMPRQSEVCAAFDALYRGKGPQAATDWFYDLCVACNYIRTAQIARNIQWTTDTPYGALEITINLTKPEKDPKTIALERLQPKSGYPACMLCKENVGYAGRVNFPARQTHRIVPITLCGEPFYLQYSPYAYFHEHCIILHEQHKPMEMTADTLAQILHFIEQFPHYTCGSNADLPIVGGSILSHSHFQGGRYVFPMQKAGLAVPLRGGSAVWNVEELGILNWPVSAIRIADHSKDAVLAAAAEVLRAWRGYSDEGAGILAAEADGTPHNTVTPIGRYDPARGYVLDLALRNNRVSGEYPDGIFHPHRQWHNIKKENIGLIEVMGLAILPARLKDQSAAIADILTGAAPNTARAAGSPLAVHADWIDALIAQYGTAMARPAAEEALRQEIGTVFSHVLEDTGVFKQDAAGRAAFLRFAASLGLQPA